MDITAIDVAGLGGLVTALGSLVKAFRSDTSAQAARAEAEAIKKQRAETAILRDEEVRELREQVAILKVENEAIAKRLDEGNDKFDRFEQELRATNGLLRELLGALKARMNMPVGGAAMGGL